MRIFPPAVQEKILAQDFDLFAVHDPSGSPLAEYGLAARYL